MRELEIGKNDEQYEKEFEIIVSGGILNIYKHFLLGPTSEALFENIRVDTAFLSVTAASIKERRIASSGRESLSPPVRPENIFWSQLYPYDTMGFHEKKR